MSHPDPTREYGENEIGTPPTTSEGKDELENYVEQEYNKALDPTPSTTSEGKFKHPRDAYCGRCGRLLRRLFVDRYFDFYDGHERFNILWECPRKRWYNQHSKFKSDDEGNTRAFES